MHTGADVGYALTIHVASHEVDVRSYRPYSPSPALSPADDFVTTPQVLQQTGDTMVTPMEHAYEYQTSVFHRSCVPPDERGL